MTYGSFLYPPQIHLEQEEPLNLDEENDMIEGSLPHMDRFGKGIPKWPKVHPLSRDSY